MTNQRSQSDPVSETSPAEPRVWRPEPAPVSEQPREVGGRKGPEPVRYGDWEKNGRCIDF